MNGPHIQATGMAGAAQEAATRPSHFVYQRIHTRAGRPLHLAAHLDLAARAFAHIYGGETPVFDKKAVITRIAELLRVKRSPARGSATVMLYFSPTEKGGYELSMEYERPLLDVGHALSSLRPKAVSYEYSIPFGGFPTVFQLSAKDFYDSLALMHHGATRSVRRDGDRLMSCGDAPLFAIKGRRIVTTPLIEGVVESVERRLVKEAAAQERFTLIEETLRHSEMRDFDELFYADAAGITSLAECDGAKFMSLAAERLAAAMRAMA